MEKLTTVSFSHMLEECNRNSRYRGMIVFHSPQDIKEFIDSLTNLYNLTPIPGIKIIKQRLNSGTIEFLNGSIINLILANTEARGHRANLILVDEDIDESTKRNVEKFLAEYITPFSDDEADVELADTIYKYMVAQLPSYVGFEMPDCIVSICDADSSNDEKTIDELDDFLNEFRIIK